MPPKRSTAAAVGKTLEERRDAARDAALKELKALRADLTTLEAVLSGRRKASDISRRDPRGFGDFSVCGGGVRGRLALPPVPRSWMRPRPLNIWTGTARPSLSNRPAGTGFRPRGRCTAWARPRNRSKPRPSWPRSARGPASASS